MPKKTLKNFLISFAVVIVAGIGCGVLEHLAGSSATPLYLIPMALGFSVFSLLQIRSGTSKEVRVDDAARQAAISAVAPAGQALLYLYREGFVGKAVGWDVTLDFAKLAQLRSPRFTQTTVPAGSHTLRASVSGVANANNKSGETTFEAQSGEVIVFALKSKAGALGVTLSFVREQDARAALQKFSKMHMVAAERAAGATAA
jgi:hypothetical protein